MSAKSANKIDAVRKAAEAVKRAEAKRNKVVLEALADGQPRRDVQIVSGLGAVAFENELSDTGSRLDTD